MQTIRYSVTLAAALISWPVLAQEPPASVKESNANIAIKPRAFLDAPSPEPSGSPIASNPGTVIKQDAESVQPKNGVPAGPILTILPILSSFPPLSKIGEPDDTLVSLGAWFTRYTGSVVKTGEYQGTSPSPFWVIDGLYSNGYRTLGIYGNQTDNESNQASIHYFQPNFVTDFDYQRFIHRLEHVSLDNFTPSNPITDKTNFPANSTALGKDLHLGQEFAIRVDELRSSTGWKINDNLRVRVDFWQMRKFGERQENAVAHCFVAGAGGSKNCHVLSQSQHIDWTTTEVTPRLEARFGPVTLEYSRPMRQFSDNDQVVSRDYNNGSLFVPSSAGGMIWGTYPYAIVPQTLTQIDQLKGSVDLGPTRQFYGFGMVGNTDNRDRDVHRDFNSGDVRFTDWTIPRTSVTLYAKTYNQTGNRPTSFLADGSDTQFLTPALAAAEIRSPIEYHRNTAGIKGSWRPDFGVGLFKDVTFTGGWEYDYLKRENAIWQTPFLSSPGSPAGSQEVGIFSQPNTTMQTLFVGARKPWGYNFDTFVRYKVHFGDNVLFGFRELSDVLNTALPQQQHIVEFGGGWYPTGNFSITLDQNIEVGQTRKDHSAVAEGNLVDFREQSYATTLTASYAPTHKLSMIVSVSFYSDWINQNVFLGDDYVDPESPLPPGAKMPLATQPTYYAGRSELFNVYLNYKLTDNTRLTLGYQFVHGSNQLNMSANPTFGFNPALSTSEPKGPITFTDLAQFSAVRVDTNKITAGIIWRPRPRMTLGVHYDFFAFTDETNSSNSGVAHQFNANLTYFW